MSQDDSEDDGGSKDAPLSDLAERVGRRREAAAARDAEDAFVEAGFEPVDTEPLWDDPAGTAEGTFGAVGDVQESGDDTYVVSVRNFCERCPHFTTPPRAECSHDGTEIREFVDKNHVRVYNCPVVEDRGLDRDRPMERARRPNHY